MVIDGVPYKVKAKPFMFKNELRFKVSYNDSEEYIFTRDFELKQLIDIDSNSTDIPDNLEETIAEKLNKMVV